MSTAVTKLLTEAHTAADLRNAEVITAAFKARGLRCSDCDYPQNARLFDRLMSEYANAKCDHHYCKVRFNPLVYRDGLSIWDWDTDKICHSMCEAENRANKLHQRLDAIRPCHKCQKQFNPTGRTRRSWKDIPKRWPNNCAKEFLD